MASCYLIYNPMIRWNLKIEKKNINFISDPFFFFLFFLNQKSMLDVVFFLGFCIVFLFMTIIKSFFLTFL